MTRSVTAGEVLEREYLVQDSWSTPILGDPVLHVLSTPALVAAVELTCKELVEQYTEENEQSVGVMINLKHLAPTPAGASFKVRARLSAAGEGGYEFEFEASDASEKIGVGTHTRFVVKLDRFRKRIQVKTASQR